MNANSQSNIREDNEPKSEQSASPEEELVHCRGELRLKILEYDEFLKHLNQKLRTPLNAITGFAELLERQCANTSMADNVSQILKGARDLLDVINRELAEPKYTSFTSKTIRQISRSCSAFWKTDQTSNYFKPSVAKSAWPLLKPTVPN